MSETKKEEVSDSKQRILAIDVGSGTQDILAWREDLAVENCPKMVLPSATTILAAKIDRARIEGRHLFLSGRTMGGGPCTRAVRRHLGAGLKVFALKGPALTFHDDLEKVKGMGVRIVDSRPRVEGLEEIEMADVNIESIGKALRLFDVALPGLIAVAVQDHGFSPDESNRAFRFKQWLEVLERGHDLDTLLYSPPPPHLTRMKAVTETVPGAWVMDTGAAAILGALLDPWASLRKEEGITIVNIGNEHTVAALYKGTRAWGFYEHHTSLLDPEKLKAHLERFRRGALTNQEVFGDQGHGCQVLPGAKEQSAFEPLTVTGPNRARFQRLGGHMAAPFGDMMLTGCFGLVEALNLKWKRSFRNLKR
jgi:uncharacterized protein (DUF1786 family)